MPFKDFFYLELWRTFCLAKQNHLCKCGRGHPEEQFYEFGPVVQKEISFLVKVYGRTTHTAQI